MRAFVFLCRGRAALAMDLRLDARTREFAVSLEAAVRAVEPELRQRVLTLLRQGRGFRPARLDLDASFDHMDPNKKHPLFLAGAPLTALALHRPWEFGQEPPFRFLVDDTKTLDDEMEGPIRRQRVELTALGARRLSSGCSVDASIVAARSVCVLRAQRATVPRPERNATGPAADETHVPVPDRHGGAD